jgi:hypothetical protein
VTTITVEEFVVDRAASDNNTVHDVVVDRSTVVPATWINATTTTTTTTTTNEEYVIRFRCDVTIRNEFSKLLLRVLPASKVSIEEQGSTAVRIQILNDVKGALDTVPDAYRQWAKEQQPRDQQQQQQPPSTKQIVLEEGTSIERLRY